MSCKQLLVTGLLALASATGHAQTTPFPREGLWRGVFTVGERQAPFQFEITGKSVAEAKVYLLNGTERVELGNLNQQGDSLFVPVEVYDSQLAFKVGKDQLAGVLRSLNNPGAGLPLLAEYGKKYPLSRKPGKTQS